MNLPEVPLFFGEQILYAMLKGVTYSCSVLGSISGKLVVTNYKLYFIGTTHSKKTFPFSIEVPLCTISHVEKVGGTSAVRSTDVKNPYGVDVICKDLRTLRFIMKQENKQRKILLEKLQELCFPSSNKLPFFAFLYKEELFGQEDGWNIYEPEREFFRQGLPVDSWRITDINQDYKLCDTYPKCLVVPSSASDDDLRSVAQFRSRARIPVLSWINPNKQVTITRCSQPLTGFGKRSREDEKYLQTILDTNPQCEKLLIIDARPQANAIANMARGGGYEKSEYATSQLVFCDIQNIHVMRESLKKLQDACHQLINDDKHWLTNLEQSQWFHHGKCILAAAIRVVDSVENKMTSVLVHCSDGWDRTAQITGLAMIMLDSYYRTLEGFQVLIEKEWISFGHKFAQRIGHGDKNHSDSERSPVFLQFLDCVWQITQQDVKGKCKSLWSLIAANREEYLNPLYVTSFQSRIILPTAAIRHLSVWSAYFLRYNPKHKPQDTVFKQQRELINVRDSLKKSLEELEKKFASEQEPQNKPVPLPKLKIAQV